VAGASGQIVFEDLFINRGELRPRGARGAVTRIVRAVTPRAR